MTAQRQRRAVADILDRSGAVPPPRWRDRIAETGSALVNIAGFGPRLPAPAMRAITKRLAHL